MRALLSETPVAGFVISVHVLLRARQERLEKPGPFPPTSCSWNRYAFLYLAAPKSQV